MNISTSQLFEAIIDLGPSYVFRATYDYCEIYKVFVDNSYEKLTISSNSSVLTLGRDFALNESKDDNDTVKYDVNVDRLVLSCSPPDREDRYLSIFGATDNPLFLKLYVLVTAEKLNIKDFGIDLGNYSTLNVFDSCDAMVNYFSDWLPDIVTYEVVYAEILNKI